MPPGKFIFSTEYFHSEFWLRQSDTKRAEEKARLLGAIKSQQPDYLVLLDDEVIEFIGQSLKDLRKPLFFSGVNSHPDWIRENTGLLGEEYSLVQERYPCQNAVNLLNSLGKPVKKIGLLTADLPTSKLIHDQCKEALASIPNVHTAFSLRSSFLSEWLDPKLMAKSVADAILILIPYGVNDASGVEVPIEKIGKLLRKNNSKPLVGILDVHTKIGLHAAFTLDPKALGQATATQILFFVTNKKLGKVATVQADSFAVNQDIWQTAFGPIPQGFRGQRVSSEELKLGR